MADGNLWDSPYGGALSVNVYALEGKDVAGTWYLENDKLFIIQDGESVEAEFSDGTLSLDNTVDSKVIIYFDKLQIAER